MSSGIGVLPPEFDESRYSERNSDLRKFNAAQLKTHFETYGRREGRISTSIANRRDFTDLIDRDRPVLEIGPFLTPSLKRPEFDVEYFDVLNRDQMIARAKKIMDLSGGTDDYYAKGILDAQEIKFVHPTGDLRSVGQNFQNVFSSHCIEHQVNIIAHLNAVYDLLVPGGRYYVVAPDKRYCFDHFHPESRFIDAIEEELAGRKFHSPIKVLEHTMNLTHNDPVRHWAGDHGAPRLEDDFFETHPGVFENVLEQARLANTQYIDVHHWIFTDDGFRKVMGQLYDRKFIKMPLIRVYQTLRNSMEFYAVFEKPAI